MTELSDGRIVSGCVNGSLRVWDVSEPQVEEQPVYNQLMQMKVARLRKFLSARGHHTKGAKPNWWHGWYQKTMLVRCKQTSSWWRSLGSILVRLSNGSNDNPYKL